VLRGGLPGGDHLAPQHEHGWVGSCAALRCACGAGRPPRGLAPSSCCAALRCACGAGRPPGALPPCRCAALR
jgi:hypothetical protein